MKKRLVALLVLVLVMMLALVSCGDPLGDWLNQIKPGPEPEPEKEVYAVYFSTDEGTHVPSQDVKEGDLVTRPEDPTKNGFEFAGWYKDAERTSPWNFDSDKVEHNTIIYAKWVAHKGGTPTCTSGPICESCGKEYGKPLGHTEEIIPGKAPTCKDAGLTDGKKCSVCGETLVAQEEIPATGEHTWGDWIVDKAATDTEDGAKHRDCSVCGDREDATIPNLSHTHSYESEDTTAPGCETKGVKTYTCGCGHSYTEEIPATGHAWNAGEDTTAPGCETKGEKTFTCQNDASHTYKEEIPATGHTAGEAVVENEVAADCKTAGSYDTVVYCESCDAELSRETKTVDPTGHVDEDGDFKCDYECGAIVEPEADSVLTIEEAEALAALFAHDKYTTNKYYIVCVIDNVYNTTFGNINVKDSDFVIYGLYSYDGETRYDAMTNKPGKGDEITVYGVIGKYNTTLQMKNGWLDDFIVHEHDYSEATCKDVATCSICGATKGELAEHKYVDGVCSVCGHEEGAAVTEIVFDFGNKGSAAHVDGNDLGASKSYTVGAYTLNLTGMEKVYGGAYDAKGNSCIKLGTSSVTAKLSFTVPNDVVSVTINIAKYKANTAKISVNGTAYTLTKNSNDGQYDAIVVDTSTNKTVSLVTVSGGARAMIDSIVFTLGETEPECQHEGGEATCENKAVCDLCGEEYGELADHVAGETVVENNVDPNCTEKGSYDNVVYCSVCDKELSRTPVEVDALGHSEEVVSGKAATCTTTGLTDGKKCSVCDKVTVAQEVINALGHNEVVDAAVAATCTTTGLTEGKHCSVCNTVLVVQEVIPAGHSDENNDNRCDDCNQSLCETHIDNEGVVTTPATCTTTGVKTYTCTACGANYTKEIAALGHRLENVPKVNPTCTQPGHTAYQECSREGCDYETMSAVIAPTNHNYSEEVTTPATCVNEGVKTFTCSKCGDSYTEKIAINPDNHSLADVEGKDATCTVDGYTAYKECTREGCDHITGKETIPATGHKDENGDYKCDVCSAYLLPEVGTAFHLSLYQAKLGKTLYFAGAMNGYYYKTTEKLCEATDLYLEKTDGGYYIYFMSGETQNYLYIQASDTYINVKYGSTKDVWTFDEVLGVFVNDVGGTDYYIGTYSTYNTISASKLSFISGDKSSTIGVDNFPTRILVDNHTCSYSEATCTTPKTCVVCGATEGEALGHTEGAAATCTTDQICTVCETVLVKAHHVDENENCICDVCKADLGTEGIEGKTITFDLGANGTASHNDGTKITTDKSYTANGYTLKITNLTNVYGSARDAKGNSVLKLGTSSATGSFKFTVPDDVTSVVIYVAKYKSNTSKITVNGKSYTLTKNSNDGNYDVITVDTTTTKTVSFATVSGGVRAMINTIEFIVPGKEGAQHVHNVATKEENRVESTCAVAGHYELVTYCADEDCGEVISRETKDLPLADHTPGTAVEEGRVESTCTVAGYYYSVVYCSVCETHEISRTKVDLDRADHSYEPKVTDPTCEESGYRTYTCSVCGDSYKDPSYHVDSLGHKGGVVEIENDIPATCTTDGSYDNVIYCTVCNKELSRTTIPVDAKGHNYYSYTKIDPSCTTEGLQVTTCTRTECDYYKEDVLPAVGHKEETIPGKDATCTEDGLTGGKQCTVCKVTTVEQTKIPAAGHKEVTDKAVDATCTATGLTEGKHCEVCGTVLVAQETVDALGHKEVTDNAVAATCTTAGKTEGKHCSVCGTVTVAQTTVNALGHTADEHNICKVCGINLCGENHTVVTDDAVAATCTETGLTEGSHCSKCGTVLVAQEEVPARGHDKVSHDAKAANCTEIGWNAYETCTRCDYSTYEEIAALGHRIENAPKINPTCTEEGHTVYKECVREGCDYETPSAVIPPLGHDKVSHDAKAANCTEIGWNAYETCSRCNYTTYVEIPALGHRIENAPKINPTCTKEGHTAYQECVREGCDYETPSAVIPALGHTAVVDAAVAATCTATGLTEGSHCSVCEAVLVAQTEVPATGHAWNDATCEAPKTCGTCGATDGEANGHAWDNDCDTTCNNGCGETRVITHSYTSVVTDPTCSRLGYTTYKCSVCGYSYTGDEVETVPHKDETGDYLCDYNCNNKVLPAEGEAISIADAIKIGTLYAHNTYTETKYYITGIVESVANTTYGNMNIVDENGNKIYIYGFYDATGEIGYNALTYKPVKGDEVTVYTVIGNYNGPQLKSVWMDEVVAHKHKYNSVVTEPTCFAGGYTTHTCSICDNSYTDAETEALGHTTENGTCERCGNTIGGEVETTTVTVKIADYAAANGWANSTQYKTLEADHNIVVTVTDTKGTYHNTGKYYTNGNNWRIYQNEAPQIVFTASNGATIVSVKITYTVDKTGVLTLNGNNISSDAVVDVNASSIKFSVGNTGTATNGNIQISAIEVVYSGGSAPCAHTTDETLWGDGEVTTAATCTTAGVKTFTCEVCGDSKREAIPVDSTAHNLVDVKAKEATCTADGYTAHKDCSNCDYTEGKETIEALGHTTENGTCERCGEEIGGDAPVLENKTYSYTFTKKVYTANNQTQDLGGTKWKLTGARKGTPQNFDTSKGQQFGSKNNPYTTLTFTTETEFTNVSSIKINTSGASGINAKVSITVGGKQLGSSQKLTTAATEYEFKNADGSTLSGQVVITYTISARAVYLKTITINYATPVEN